MRGRYLLKRLKREIPRELAKRPREDWEMLVDLHLLLMDNSSKETVWTYWLQRSYAQQLLDGVVTQRRPKGALISEFGIPAHHF